MLKQLEEYDIQIKTIAQRIEGMQDSILSNEGREIFDTSSMKSIQEFIQNYRSQIAQMQSQIRNIQNNN